MNYYNEHDPKAAHWLWSLIAAGLIPDGHVDERSICDVKPSDLSGFVQVHLFAGIGGWAYALQLAGWPADAPVWTGSCPCQPFSSAGKRRGTDDERHLWPEMYRLVSECKPATCFGEQVASNDGLRWFAGVRTDLEASDYAVGCSDLPAASVGAPHRRQRLFWVADATSGGPRGRRGTGRQDGPEAANDSSLGDTGGTGLEIGIGDGRVQRGTGLAQQGQAAELPGDIGGVGNTEGERKITERVVCGRQGDDSERVCELGSWSDYRIIPCEAGKVRRIESGTEPLVDGFPGRVAILRGLGNAIVPQVAAKFIKAWSETRPACT